MKKKIALLVFAGMLIGTSVQAKSETISYSKEMPVFSASISDIPPSLTNASFFNASAQLATGLRMVRSAQRVSYYEMLLYDTDQSINDVKRQLEEAKVSRNQLSDIMKTTKSINDPMATKVLSMHLKAINSYVTANMYLKQYHSAPTQYNLNMYIKHDENAYNLSVEIAELSQERYAHYMKKALNSLQ